MIPGLTYTPNLRMGRDNKYGIPIPGLPPTMPPTAVGTVAAIGVNNTVVARASTAIGNENFAIGWASLATGYTTSSVGELMDPIAAEEPAVSLFNHPDPVVRRFIHNNPNWNPRIANQLGMFPARAIRHLVYLQQRIRRWLRALFENVD